MTTLNQLLAALMSDVPDTLYRSLAPTTYRLIAELRRARRHANAARVDALLRDAEAGEFDVRRSTRAFPIRDLARTLERCGLSQLAHAARRGYYGPVEPPRAYTPTPIGVRRQPPCRCK